MQWQVVFHQAFEAEVAKLPLGVQEALAPTAVLQNGELGSGSFWMQRIA